jgi:hypothetical protein
MFRSEQEIQMLESELNSWKRKLQNKHSEAIRDINVTIERIKSRFSLSELAQFKAQMLNGVATPQDFTLNRVA